MIGYDHKPEVQVSQIQTPHHTTPLWLWCSWVCLVVAVACHYYWYHHGGHFQLIGLIIRSSSAGVLGLIVLTKLEMILNPQHFYENRA